MGYMNRQRERILQLGARPEFLTAVRGHLGQETADQLEQRLECARQGSFTVAVLGPEGVGKSSLIDGLLRMGFPAGDGGVVLADTPGYGSPDPERELTTRELLRQVSAALFLFSTTPPLLRPDLEFLHTVQGHCRRLFYVQTTAGEEPGQIELARAYNARQISGDPQGEPIYVVDIRAALAADDEAAFAAAGARALADDLAAYLAQGPHGLSLRDAHLAVLDAAWRLREALAHRRRQIEADLRRAEGQARLELEREQSTALTAALQLQQALAAFRTELRLAERDFSQQLWTATHALEAELADMIGQGRCTRPLLEERARAKWQSASAQLDASLKSRRKQLAEHLDRQLRPVWRQLGVPPAGGAPTGEEGQLVSGPGAAAPASSTSLTSADTLVHSLHAIGQMIVMGVREECQQTAQACFDQMATWADQQAAALDLGVRQRQDQAARLAAERSAAAAHTQHLRDDLAAHAQLIEAMLAELQALAAEALS